MSIYRHRALLWAEGIEASVGPITYPTLSNWKTDNTNKDRIYFDSSEIITGTTYGGFTVASPSKTITGISINAGQTTGHYFTVNSDFSGIDSPTIAYSGTGSNIQDLDSNPLQAFSATAIANYIEILEDSYSETLRSGSWSFFTYKWHAQIFRPDNSTYINRAVLNMYKQGTVLESSIYCYLYSTSGTPPNAEPSTLLGAANPVSTSVLGTNNQGLVSFSFEGIEQYHMEASTWYAILGHHADDIGDADTVRWGIDSTSPTHPGNAARADDVGGTPGSWSAESGTDKPFYIYGIKK